MREKQETNFGSVALDHVRCGSTYSQMAATSSSNNSTTSTTTTTTTTTTTNSTTTNNNNNIETDEFIKKSRVTRAAPPKPAYDPLQFVQIKPAKLYDLNKAKPSTERKVVEVKTPREVEDAEEWQCNLDNWKSSRRKRVEHIIDKITEAKKIEQEEVYRGRKKSKTFSEMLENSGSRRRFILPENEDDDEGGSFSDDLHDPHDASKQQYKDESTDDRATDDTSSCCSSKLTDGESKTPDLDDARDAPEMNEFSLAIENYKSKFPMTQSKVSQATQGSASVVTTITCSSLVSSIESNGNDNYESISTCEEAAATPEATEHSAMEYMTQKLTELEVKREEKRCLVTVEPMESRIKTEANDKQQAHDQETQEERPKVNVIERRRLFEQFQQMACSTDAPVTPSTVTKPLNSAAAIAIGSGQQQERRHTDDTSSSTDDPSSSASSDWLAAGSIKERRAIFERYQSNEMIAEEHDQPLNMGGGGRSRSNTSSNSTTVVKSRSESNVGFINGSTGRFELALNQLKRNGTDYCEDSGIHSTTDLSRSSVVSQADDHEPSMLLLLPPDESKSPVRSTTLDSASEFSDTDCSNGQLLDNALDVAFEEMDSELNESGTAEQQIQSESARSDQQETEIVPLSVVTLPANETLSDEQLVLMSLPKSTLTPPKEKPPPPPVDEEPELELQPPLSAAATITSWMHKSHSNGNGNIHSDLIVAEGVADMFEPKREKDLRAGGLHHMPDEQWRSLESYEVVQQVQKHQQHQQLKQHVQEKEPERDKDQQEVMVYSNRIETLPHHHHQHHHHQLYDPGEHEEIVSVERELLQIEQEELQRRREKQIFYEKLTKVDSARANEQQHQQQQQQQQQQLQMQSQQQLKMQQQQQQQQQEQQSQQPYYYPHHNATHQSHHNLHHHHRASMPAIDSRSLQNVNSYASYETPFLDDMNSYDIGSLHRESMPNLSNVAASSSHTSSLSSYGEEYSANSATSFDGGCWPPPAVDHRQGAGRPTVAPRPTLNGFPDRATMAPGVVGYNAPNGGGHRLSSNMFEQHPKDNKQNAAHHPTLANRVPGGQGGMNNMPYGQHWLVQEAEQRRIEQHQKSTSTNSAKRPLPKFVIDAITQRVQKLNAGSPENSDRSVLSEDSDLAMINSMKHHHHHQQSQSVPSHHHHHHQHQQQQQQQQQHHHHQQQQPLPPTQQQKYSNSNDKVLSVSGKKECSHCRIELGKGAAMAIESLGLFYHIECFKCCVCHVKLGDGTNGIDVRVRKYRLHCQNCFSSEDGVKFSCV